MRVFAALAILLTIALWTPEANAQSLQCRQQISAEAQELCAESEIDDLDDRVKYWRGAARQRQPDYDHFARRRDRCDGEYACIARELHMEISELQVTLEPAQRARVTSSYSGPVVYRPVTPMSELDAAMDRIITRDSWGWMFNRYDRGSVRNTRVVLRNGSDRIVYSDFTYNGGRPGWVQLYIVDGRLGCVEYHDFMGQCRPVGARSYSHALTTRVIAAATIYALRNY